MSIIWSSSSFKSMVFLHFIKYVFHSYQMGKGNIQEFTKMLRIVILLWAKCFTLQKMYCLSAKASLPTVFSLFYYSFFFNSLSLKLKFHNSNPFLP